MVSNFVFSHQDIFWNSVLHTVLKTYPSNNTKNYLKYPQASDKFLERNDVRGHAASDLCPGFKTGNTIERYCSQPWVSSSHSSSWNYFCLRFIIYLSYNLPVNSFWGVFLKESCVRLQFQQCNLRIRYSRSFSITRFCKWIFLRWR